MKKRLLSTLLALVMVLTLLPSTTSAATAQEGTPPSIPTTGDVWDGTFEPPETRIQQEGISYYEITKCSQLAYVAKTGDDWLTYNYILGNNLILNSVTLAFDGEGNCTNTESLLEWTPIGGGSSQAFSGKFLGNGYTVSGMYISGSFEYVGMFGYVYYGKICDLKLVNSYVSNSTYYGHTGGIAGDYYNPEFSKPPSRQLWAKTLSTSTCSTMARRRASIS